MMRGFIVGVIVGWATATWYYAQTDVLRTLAVNLWSEASAPSAPPPRAH
jgi:hypothetical protein